MSTFHGGTAHVRAPATSANLGSGYDSLGLALALHDYVTAAVAPEGLTVEVSGEGVDLARDETHLLVRAMRATFDRLGAQPPGLAIECTNRIPHGRGLGSSAATIVSGVLLARALVAGGDQALPDGEAFALAAVIEGHPDNVAACWYGGLTVSWTDPHAGRGPAFRAIRTPVTPEVHPVALIPAHASSTAATRGLLPRAVPHADAAFAVARAALLVGALAAGGAPQPDTLLAATDDRLHQPYRAVAMPDTADLVARLRGDGHAAFVSGAGPTVLVLAADQVEVEAVRTFAPDGWRAETPVIDTDGAAATVTVTDAT